MSKNNTLFGTLNITAEIYNKIIGQPWWRIICNDPELYIHVRKDNSINAYYKGGSVLKISYNKNTFKGETNHKYYANNIDLLHFNIDLLNDIKNNIIKHYSGTKSTINNSKAKHDTLNSTIFPEGISEKYIQGTLIEKNNGLYIDSEFQFNKDKSFGNIRIDLLELSNGVLSFIEIKKIGDNRLWHDPATGIVPEIVGQMERYKNFITSYKNQITDYYVKLLQIKHTLGLYNSPNTSFKLNTSPKLLIINNYQKDTLKRTARIKSIDSLLSNHANTFEYKILQWK